MADVERTPVLALVTGLALGVVPYVATPRPLPVPTAGPFDNVWIAEFTNAIAGGAPLTVAPDPWFRYVPQSVALWVLSLVRPVGVADAVLVNAGYTLLCEVVFVPLALYWFVAGARSRRAGVGAVVALAAVRAVLIPMAAPVGPEIDATVWYFTQHWQYSFALPWALVALGAVVRATRAGADERPSVLGLTTRQGYVLLTGVGLGLAGSVQLVHGAVAAYVVAVTCLWTGQWRVLAGTALCAVAVALPNLLVVARYPGRWLTQGIEKSAAGAGSVATEYLLALAVLSVGGLVAAAFASRDGSAVGRTGSVHAVVPALGVVSGALVCLFVLADARWYKYHALYLCRFAVVCWAGIVLDRRWSPVVPFESGPVDG